MSTKIKNELQAPDGSYYVTLTDGGGNLLTVGGGTVTSVSVTTANGISGSVATSTTTPAITLTLGAIVPTSIVTGTILSTDLRSTKTSNYTILTTDSGTQFDNIGASGEVDFTLPTAASGLKFGLYVGAAQVLKVIAPASTTIRLAGSVSVSAGNITNSTIGGYVELEAVSSTQYVGRFVTGTWTVT